MDNMDALQAILTRRSVRQFTDKAIPQGAMRTLLAAAMAGPSCVNARDWSFIVVEDKPTLNATADANGRPAEPLRGAAAAILVCGDTARAFPPARDYWVIDCAIAAQNITLAAHALGLGSVWLGTWPQRWSALKRSAGCSSCRKASFLIRFWRWAAPHSRSPRTRIFTSPTVCILAAGKHSRLRPNAGNPLLHFAVSRQ